MKNDSAIMGTMLDLIISQLDRSIATLSAVRDDQVLLETVIQVASVTAEAMKRGNKLLVAGNGGSAADSQHLVAEFVCRLVRNRPALPAIALTTDSSIMTAVSNDFGYDNVFERQIEALGQPGDIFLGISTSGNSVSLVRALEMCRKKGVTSVGYLGNKGGAMAPLCDYCVIVPSSTTMHIQESHLALEHALCALVERFYFGENFDSDPPQAT